MPLVRGLKQMTQGQRETVLQCVIRLRAAAKDCGYGEDTEKQIRDEVLCKCLANIYWSARSVHLDLHYLIRSWYI